MGFIQAFTGALGGAFANQWVDFLTVPEGIAPTAAVFQAVPQGTNAGRGANTKGSTGIITNGSKILVPEGYGLITLQDGAVTGFISEAGGYVFSSDDQNSKSMFTGGGIFSSTLKTSWEQFKRGGQPGSQQLALFVNLKEIPNNKFGTQSEIYWDDAYVNAQVGALARGTYTLRIVDPILFVKGFVPASYITEGQVFDFGDFDNPAASQLFSEVVASLAQAFSIYSNDPNKEHRITKLQSDSVGFAASLSKAVEDNYTWKTSRGLEIEKVAIAAIEYDEDTRALLSDVKKADALSGNRSGSFLNQSIARGVQGAGENGGGEGLLGFGFGAGAVGGLIQPQGNQVGPQTNQNISPDDGLAKLQKAKAAFDAGLISEEDYKKAKADYLGL